MPRLALLTVNNIHTVEHYGYLITYMGLKNIISQPARRSSCNIGNAVSVRLSGIVKSDTLLEKLQRPVSNSHEEGDDNEITITNYHCGALFVLLGPVRDEVRKHGCFAFRLASVAGSGT
jgi:hypothetical protein